MAEIQKAVNFSLLSFIAGVALASFGKISIAAYILLVVLTLLASFLAVFRVKFAAVFFIFIFLLFGAITFEFAKQRSHRFINIWQNHPLEFEGTVNLVEPAKDGFKRVVLEEEGTGKVVAFAGDTINFKAGQILKVECKKLEIGKDEANQNRMAREGIWATCYYPRLSVIKNKTGFSPRFLIDKVKGSFERSLSAVFPQPVGSLVAGILLGGSNRMTNNLKDAFSRTGLTHIVAVSGYNVTLVANFCLIFFIVIGFNRGKSFWISIAVIFLFILMVGTPASAVRAGIMGSIVLWASKVGRMVNSLRSLAICAAAMLVENPFLLRYDLGFSLSFLSTAGIILTYPLLKKIFSRGRGINIFTEAIFLTFSACVLTYPLLLLAFGRLPLLAIPINAVVAPVIPVAMFGGLIAGLVGLVNTSLAQVVAWPVYSLLRLMISGLEAVSKIPWVNLEINAFSPAYAIFYYAVTLFLIYQLKNNIDIDKVGVGSVWSIFPFIMKNKGRAKKDFIANEIVN